MFTSRKLYSLRRQGLFFSWSSFQRYFQLLPGSALTSTGNSSSALLRGVEMKGLQCVLLAARVRGHKEGGFPPSPQPMCLQPCDLTQPTFPHLHLGHSVGKERVFLILSFSSSGHNYGVVTQQITTLPFLLGKGARLYAPTFY